MARHGKYNSINFGYGKKLEYATKNALRTYYRNGHFATVTAHTERSRIFLNWAYAEHKIDDVRNITNEVFSEYAAYLKLLLAEEEISIDTATNRISSVNIVLAIMREDQKIRIEDRKSVV